MAEPEIIGQRGALTSEEAETRYLSLGQAAKVLGVSTRTLERHRLSGKLIPAGRTPGGHARYSAAQLEALKVVPTPSPAPTAEDANAFMTRTLALRRIRSIARGD